MRPTLRAWLALALTLAALCTIREVVRSAVERRVAAALDKNPRFAGSYARVDVSVLRLSYTIEGLRLVKRNGRIPVPFVSAPLVEYRFDWLAFVRGRASGTA